MSEKAEQLQTKTHSATFATVAFEGREIDIDLTEPEDYVPVNEEVSVCATVYEAPKTKSERPVYEQPAPLTRGGFARGVHGGRI